MCSRAIINLNQNAWMKWCDWNEFRQASMWWLNDCPDSFLVAEKLLFLFQIINCFFFSNKIFYQNKILRKQEYNNNRMIHLLQTRWIFLIQNDGVWKNLTDSIWVQVLHWAWPPLHTKPTEMNTYPACLAISRVENVFEIKNGYYYVKFYTVCFFPHDSFTFIFTS